MRDLDETDELERLEARSEGRQPPHDIRVVTVADADSGEIDFDDLGQARWKWITEMELANASSADSTFDYLKALDNDALSLADEDAGSAGEPTDTGYNPYDTVRLEVPFRKKQP